MFKSILESINRLFRKSESTEVKVEEPVGDAVFIVKDDYTKMKAGEYCEYTVSSLTEGSQSGRIRIGNSTRFAIRWLIEANGMDVINQLHRQCAGTPFHAVDYFLSMGCAWSGDLFTLECAPRPNPLVSAYMDWYTKQSKGLKVKIEKWSGDRLVVIVDTVYGDGKNEVITSGSLITEELLDRAKSVNELFKDKIIDDIRVNGQQRGYVDLNKVVHCIRSSLYSKKFDIVGSNILLDHDNNIQLTLSEEKKDDQATH